MLRSAIVCQQCLLHQTFPGDTKKYRTSANYPSILTISEAEFRGLFPMKRLTESTSLGARPAGFRCSSAAGCDADRRASRRNRAGRRKRRNKPNFLGDRRDDPRTEQEAARPLVPRAIFEVTASKQGISAAELQRKLGLGSYQTAWSWLTKIRLIPHRLIL